MVHVHDSVVELILLKSDVKDLIRYKSACKSWHSLITSPSFINQHLNFSYNKDRYNNKIDHCSRTILVEELMDNNGAEHFVGSSNGLVCISGYGSRFLVGNPMTREIRRLKPRPWIGSPTCWGFGYDSSRDDYKVIVGALNCGNKLRIQVLSLKTDVWRVIGEVKYTFISKVGDLCNGALYWDVKDDKRNKRIIFSYDLSKDNFKEILIPDDDDDDASWFSDTLEENGLYLRYDVAPIFVQSLVSPPCRKEAGACE